MNATVRQHQSDMEFLIYADITVYLLVIKLMINEIIWPIEFIKCCLFLLFVHENGDFIN